MPTHSILSVAMMFVGAAVVLTIGFSWVFAKRWCKPEQHVCLATPADYGLFFESIRFFSKEVPLNGWFIPSRKGRTPEPPIIVVHGWSSSAAEMLPVAWLLHEAGFNVFLFDARGHGASGQDGPVTLLKFAEDLLASVQYLQTRSDVDTTRLGVVGHSIGGASAIVAASMDGGIRAAVTTGAFADPKLLTRDVLKRLRIPTWPALWLVCRFIERWLGTTMEDIAPQNRIGLIEVPLMLIHGDSDCFIPPSNLDLLHSRARQRIVTRLLVPGRGHSDLLRDPRCVGAAIDFLRKSLVESHEQRNSTYQRPMGSPQTTSDKLLPQIQPEFLYAGRRCC